MADAEQKPDTELVSIKVKSQDGQEVRGVAFIWALANLGATFLQRAWAGLRRAAAARAPVLGMRAAPEGALG